MGLAGNHPSVMQCLSCTKSLFLWLSEARGYVRPCLENATLGTLSAIVGWSLWPQEINGERKGENLCTYNLQPQSGAVHPVQVQALELNKWLRLTERCIHIHRKCNLSLTPQTLVSYVRPEAIRKGLMGCHHLGMKCTLTHGWLVGVEEEHSLTNLKWCCCSESLTPGPTVQPLPQRTRSLFKKINHSIHLYLK